VPGAGARAALQDPLQAGQERARVQGGGRGGAPRQRRRWTCSSRRRHRLALPVPLEALPVRQLPQGHRLPAAAAPPIKDELPLAAAKAFSIDDSHTTEIDDALSVQGLGTGTVVFGIHIAAPGLAIAAESPLDKVARERLSTVYMPGWKITMLPDEVVQAYTLTEGRDCPAVSLYVTLDEATLRSPARRSWSACPSPPTCATTSSTGHHRGHAAGEAAADYASRPSWPSPSAWRAT
jgi:hypothetical protein